MRHILAGVVALIVATGQFIYKKPASAAHWAGTTRTAASCSQSAVSNAYDLAVDGDVVQIPAGSCTWTTGLTVAKAVHIKGAGGGKIEGNSTTSNSVGTGSKTFTTQSGLDWTAAEVIRVMGVRTGASMTGTVTSYSGTSLVVNVTSTSGSGTHTLWAFEQDGATILTYDTSSGGMFAVTKDSGGYTGIGEFDIIRGTAASATLIEFGGGGLPLIAHDMRIRSGAGSSSVFYGTVNGALIYKVDAVADYGFPSGLGGDANWTGSYIDMQDNSDPWTGSWAEADFIGDRDTNGTANIYVEEADIIGFATQGSDCSSKCRMVLRYNRLTYTGLTSHGPDTGSGGGLRHWEIYNNSFQKSSASGSCENSLVIDYWINYRGGTGIIANNVMDTAGDSCLGSKTSTKLVLQGPWRDAGVFGCTTQAYPFPQQQGQNFNGSTTFTDPIYLSNNTGSGGSSFGTEAYPDECPTPNSNGIGFYIQSGRDYVSGSTKPGYTPYTYPHSLRAGVSP